MKTILNWLMGPFTRIVEVHVRGRNDAEARRLEREAQKQFMQNQLEKAILDDDYRFGQMADNLIRKDRGDSRTSWIRPVTAGLALAFWIALTLSQIEWVGYGRSEALLPIIWQVPPGQLGQIFLAFPMGVLATFYIARPIEKFLLGRRS